MVDALATTFIVLIDLARATVLICITVRGIKVQKLLGIVKLLVFYVKLSEADSNRLLQKFALLSVNF
jgi:hypothetical protein